MKTALTFQQHVLIIDIMDKTLKKLDVCQSRPRLIKSLAVGTAVLSSLASCNEAVGFDRCKVIFIGILARHNGVVE